MINLKELKKLIRQPLFLISIGAIVASLSSLLSLVEFNTDLLVSAGAAAGGAIVAVLYSWFTLRLVQKHRERNRKRVFVAYNHNDTEFVLKLSSDMKKMGVNPVLDRFELTVGDDIKSAVDRMIDTCDFFVFVASKNTMNSNWAKKEVEQALKRDKKILPIVIDEEALPKELTGLYFADFSKSYEHGFSALERTLSKYTKVKRLFPFG